MPASSSLRSQDALVTGVALCGVYCGPPGVMAPLRWAPYPTLAPGLDSLSLQMSGMVSL
jgi:hypothetical protein